MSKEYSYKGYIIRRTNISTNNGRYLYEIIEKQGILYNYIRTAGTRPFITTIASCKEYIDEIKKEER